MKKHVEQEVLSGERVLFMSRDLQITNTIFADGESPLKESKKLQVEESFFKWKYPFWYCENVDVKGGILYETARSGIWYTHHIQMTDTIIQAPKTFRRSSDIKLENISMANALESMWSCEDISLNHVVINGDYFAKDSQNIKGHDVTLIGNYGFDGCKNIELTHSKIVSKDAFWNCENVVVKDSLITGEYLAWNTKNLTLINCTVESEQGLCYVENLIMKNCRVLNTDLAFEYSTIDVESSTPIKSIKNPISGRIQAPAIETIIFDDDKIDSEQVEIILS